MGLADVRESGNEMGRKAKYKRMDREGEEEDAPSQNKSLNGNKYVFACSIFASLNSVLLGYGNLLIPPLLLFNSFVGGVCRLINITSQQPLLYFSFNFLFQLRKLS